jgi:hypothetical protein
VRTPLLALTAAAVAVPLALLAATPTSAAPKPRRAGTDSAAPGVSVTSPSSGATTNASLTVAGTASDNVGVAGVSVQVDGGSWQAASGTTSWSVPLSGLAAGGHSVTARATDAAGNSGTATVSFTVSAPAPSPSPTASPSPSPTSSPSPSPSPSPTATTSPSPTASPSPTSTSGTSSAPATQGSWTSPEGVTIIVNSAGPWTISQVYSLLTANARDLNLIGPSLTVNVQDTYASQTTTSATQSGSTFTNFQATIYLKGVNSTFTTKPDAQMGHEYGHAWTRYWLFMGHGGDWSSYLAKRWSSADGSVTLATDSRTGTSYSWDPSEIIADDYRLLFGSAAAISESPSSLNTSIVAPSAQPGLQDWFLSTWA